MAATRNLELAMRIALDIEQAQKSLPVLQRGLASIKDAGNAAGAGLDGVAKGADKAAGALDQASRSSASAADRVRTAGASMQKTVADEIRSISELDARLQRGAASMSELADTEALLDRVMARSLISTEDYNSALKTLDKQEASLTRTEQQRQRAVEGALGRYDGASVKLQKLERDERELKAAVDAGRVSREQYNRALAGINVQRNAVNLAEANNRGRGPGTISAGQYQMAMRQLPAQITDITTSIVSGMPIWMVAIQQGGQLKDSFGGVVPAARALTSALNPTTIVLGGVAAGLGLVGFAALQGYKQLRAYDAAVISTGYSLGVSSGQLYAQANAVGSVTGEYSDATAAAQQLAASGKLTANTLSTAISVAVNLAKLTGESIEGTTAKVVEVSKAPSATLAKLNEQYHFLTAAVYEQVRALEDQGKATDAAKAALEALANISDQRVKEMESRAGYLEQAWDAVARSLKRVWQGLKDIGRTDSEAMLRAETAAMRGTTGQLQQALKNGNAPAIGYYYDLQIKQMDRLRKARAAYDRDVSAAESAGQAQRIQDAGVEAAKAIASGLEEGASKAEKLKKATEEVAKQFRELRKANPGSDLLKGVSFGDDGSVSGGAYDKRVAQLQGKFKERTSRTPKTEFQKDEAAAQRELERLKQQIELAGTLDETRKKATKTAEIEAAIKEGNFQNATAKTKQELLDTAKKLDSDRLRVEAAKKLLEVQDQIANLEGRGPDAQQAKSLRELEVTRRQMVEAGNQSGVAEVDRAKELVRLTAELQKMQETYNRAMGEMGLAQQRIQVELQAGLITEAQARQKLVDLSRQQLTALGDLPDRMRATAEALKNPEALQAAEQMAVKLKEMAATTNLLQQNVRTTFQSAFRDALMSLANGNATLGEIVRSFFQSIASGLAGYVADELSAKLASTLTGKLFDKGAEVGTEVAAATATQASAAALSSAGGVVTAGASAVTSSASALAGAGGGLITGAGALSAAAVQLKQAAIALAAANNAKAVVSMVGSIAGAASNTGTVSVGTPTPVSRAQGGPVWGAGTGTSDSIPAWLSNGEFVARAKVVSQPGALAFLHAFNAIGMDAVRRWGAYAFADGGLVSQMPSLQRSPVFNTVAAAPTGSPTQLGIRLINQVSPGLFEDYIDDPGSDRTIINKINRNSAAIRQVLGL
ncbi:TPA: phage tail length tape measure family protein [Stenotrophomonas maltophilia]